MIVTGCNAETAAAIYTAALGRELDRYERTCLRCAICGDEFHPQDGGKQVWINWKVGYKYICPDCVESMDTIDEEEI